MAGGPRPQNPNPSASNAADETPCSAATAVKLVAELGLTEAEAQALLAAKKVSVEEIHDAQKANVRAVAGAFTEATVEAVVSDGKLEFLPGESESLPRRAGRVRTISSACDKLQATHDSALASGKLDSSELQKLANRVVPQIRARLGSNPALETIYSSLLSYQHARYPGRKGGSKPTKPNGAGTNDKTDQKS